MSYEPETLSLAQLTERVDALEITVRQPGFYRQEKALEAARRSLHAIGGYLDEHILEDEQLVFRWIVDQIA